MATRHIEIERSAGWGQLAPYLIILAAAVGATLPILANPGYFSHDEFQKLDHVTQHGLIDYVRSYVRVTAGDHFGVPVRPVSFLVQGLVALVMHDVPFAVHAADVLMHGLAACALFWLLTTIRFGRTQALLAALVFTASPLAMLSVGWPAALMDRLYVLFGLVAITAGARYVLHRGSAAWLIGVIGGMSLAILSKETAAALPLLSVPLLLLEPKLARTRRLWMVLLAAALPIAAFLALRMPALVESVSGAAVASPYGATLVNVPVGLWVYFAYPFAVDVTEAGNWVFMTGNAVFWSTAAHIALVALIARRFGYRATAAYLLAYFALLVPVLPIEIKGAHYLYGANIAFSAAFGQLLRPSGSRFARLERLGAGVLLAIALLHALLLQVFVYGTGVCMSRASTSAEAIYLSTGRPGKLHVTPDPGSPAHVIHRLVTGRNQIGLSHPVEMTVGEAVDIPAGALPLRFDRGCMVTLRAPR